MNKETFTIQYQGQILQVILTSDVNNQIYYRISFPDGVQLDLYATPGFDGMAPGWAEGTGEKTDRAMEIGQLIGEHNL